MKFLRKAYQRKFNRKVRQINKTIRNDNLWRGRFEIRQKDASFWEYEDHSGGELRVILRAYDKQNGYYKDFIIDYAPYLFGADWHLWEAVNKFIVEDDDVWSEKPVPKVGETKDWTNVRIPDSVMRKDENFYLSRQYFK